MIKGKLFQLDRVWRCKDFKLRFKYSAAYKVFWRVHEQEVFTD